MARIATFARGLLSDRDSAATAVKSGKAATASVQKAFRALVLACLTWGSLSRRTDSCAGTVLFGLLLGHRVIAPPALPYFRERVL
jgi:hypothetical protein